MERVKGIGGVFFKVSDPSALSAWYRDHLGIEPNAEGMAVFEAREVSSPERRAHTVWAPFPVETRYFDPSIAPFMINYRVDDLDRMLAQLRTLGATVDERVEVSELGRFGWLMDPEGNRIELWEPPVTAP